MAGDAPLRLGIAGLGMAGSMMIRGLRGWNGAQIVAAADGKVALLAEFEKDFAGEIYTDVETLCRDPSVEAVYIATPHQFHVEHVLCAAQAGKHVVVEKPLALTLEDCDRIIAAVEDSGIKLVVGPTHAFDPAVRAMRDIVRDGKLGRLSMINTWNYNDFLYRPRRPEELDTALGGGIAFNQLPHQIDSIRLLGGGRLRSVRAATGILDAARPTEGAATVFLEFEDGAAATMVYSGYDRFDSDALHGWIGEGGTAKPHENHGRTRARLAALSQDEEIRLRTDNYGYRASAGARAAPPAGQPHFGIMVVSCERGDLKPTPDGLSVFDDDGHREIALPPERYPQTRPAVVAELADAIRGTRPPTHDARWGKATLEVALAILDSARDRREILLQHQTEASS